MFSFDVPVREDVLTEYIAGFISNDRSKWKKFWTENNHTKHEDCPDEAFVMLDKYWRSDVGKRESEMMKEKRARVGASSSGSLPYSDDSPSQKRLRHDEEPEDYLEFATDNSNDPLSPVWLCPSTPLAYLIIYIEHFSPDCVMYYVMYLSVCLLTL